MRPQGIDSSDWERCGLSYSKCGPKGQTLLTGNHGDWPKCVPKGLQFLWPPRDRLY